jgi:hypothetical protein
MKVKILRLITDWTIPYLDLALRVQRISPLFYWRRCASVPAWNNVICARLGGDCRNFKFASNLRNNLLVMSQHVLLVISPREH